MAKNPLDTYIKEIIRIGTEIQERDVWRCGANRLDRLEIIRHIVVDPPADYRAVIARLRQQISGEAFTFAGVEDFLALRSVEPVLLERLQGSDVTAAVTDENRRRIIAEARQIALGHALEEERREGKFKAETIARMQQALDNVALVSRSRTAPLQHLELIEEIASEPVGDRDFPDYAKLASTYDIYWKSWKDEAAAVPQPHTAPGLNSTTLLREFGDATETVLRLESEVLHLREQLASYRCADQTAGTAIDMGSIENFDPKTYDDIVENIGRIVPCYKQGEAGCRLEDHTNSEHCADSCHMLKVYRSALAIGIAEGMRRAEDLQLACEPFARLADEADVMEATMGKAGSAISPTFQPLLENARAVRAAVAKFQGKTS
jgi:hypothetical protein